MRMAKDALVAIDGPGMFSEMKFARIERLTATQIVLDNGRRFHLDGDHREIGAAGSGRARLLDPHSTYVTTRVARALFTKIVDDASDTVHGGSAAINDMDAGDVLLMVSDTIAKLNDARKQIESFCDPLRKL